MFFGHVRSCKSKLHFHTLVFIKKTIIVNDYAKCDILILLQTLILCGKMNGGHIFFCIYMHILFPPLLLSLHKIEDYGYGDGASSTK
jgi:hypothetical protein